MSSYEFAETPKDLIESLKGIQEIVRWPKKTDKNDDSKDKSKWCDFHSSDGHTTEDCISLRKELAYLNFKGHLKDIVKNDVNDARPKSPVPAKLINCIIGGSEICGLTYSAAKKHAQQDLTTIQSLDCR